MRQLFLPFFIVRLIFTAAPSLFLLSITNLLPYRALLIASSFLLLSGFSLFRQLSPQPHNPPPDLKAQLHQQQNQLENWLKKQPTHRDILFNLSKLNQALGDEQLAHQYLNQAQALDPNYSLFIEN